MRPTFPDASGMETKGIRFLTAVAPANLADMLGYEGDARYFGVYYDYRLDSLLCFDGEVVDFNGNWPAYDLWVAHLASIELVDEGAFVSDEASPGEYVRYSLCGFMIDREQHSVYAVETPLLLTLFGLSISSADVTPKATLDMDAPIAPEFSAGGVAELERWLGETLQA
jgi:hypothetical protein